MPRDSGGINLRGPAGPSPASGSHCGNFPRRRPGPACFHGGDGDVDGRAGKSGSEYDGRMLGLLACIHEDGVPRLGRLSSLG
eukprot:267941-Amphidinium_carterae.1